MRDVNLEPIDLEAYDLRYACLLIPCQSSDPLNHVLTSSLEQWMHQICAEYGWGVDFIEAHPDYFQWGIRVSPSTQVSHFMNEIRRRTSELIFKELPGKSLSGDFWATDYLAVSGTHPLSREMIEQYIRLSRRQHQ